METWGYIFQKGLHMDDFIVQTIASRLRMDPEDVVLLSEDVFPYSILSTEFPKRGKLYKRIYLAEFGGSSYLIRTIDDIVGKVHIRYYKLNDHEIITRVKESL